MLDAGSVVFTTGSATGKVTFITNIEVTRVGTEGSGNPGYLIGKNLQYATGSTTIGGIVDTDGSCLTSAGVDLELKFGVNHTISCVSGNNPCGSSYYLDSLADGDGIQLRKYATGSESVGILGVS